MNILLIILAIVIVAAVLTILFGKYFLSVAAEEHVQKIEQAGVAQVQKVEAAFGELLHKKASATPTPAQIAANAVLAKAKADLAAANALIVPPALPGSSDSDVLAGSKANAIAYAATEVELAQAAVDAANKAALGAS
jgi:hypothetical protein